MPIDVFNYQIILYTLRWGRGGGRIIFVKNNLLTIVVLSLKIAFKALKIPIFITLNLNYYLDSMVRSKALT